MSANLDERTFPLFGGHEVRDMSRMDVEAFLPAPDLHELLAVGGVEIGGDPIGVPVDSAGGAPEAQATGVRLPRASGRQGRMIALPPLPSRSNLGGARGPADADRGVSEVR